MNEWGKYSYFSRVSPVFPLLWIAIPTTLFQPLSMIVEIIAIAACCAMNTMSLVWVTVVLHPLLQSFFHPALYPLQTESPDPCLPASSRVCPCEGSSRSRVGGQHWPTVFPPPHTFPVASNRIQSLSLLYGATPSLSPQLLPLYLASFLDFLTVALCSANCPFLSVPMPCSLPRGTTALTALTAHFPGLRHAGAS